MQVFKKGDWTSAWIGASAPVDDTNEMTVKTAQRATDQCAENKQRATSRAPCAAPVFAALLKKQLLD